MNQLPAFIANRPSRGLAARVSQNLGTSSPPYLSLMGNRFTLIDAAGNEQPIQTYEGDPNKVMRGQAVGPYCDVTIIDVNDRVSRIFYDQPFDPNAQSYQPPACFSHNGTAPSRQATYPQSPTCAACPNAVWGSATSNVSGKGIPACAQYQLISVLVAGHEMPFLLRIPPNSLKNYRAYAEQFRGQSFDMNHVVTRLSFISQGTLAFIPAAFVDQATFDKGEKLLDAKATDSMIGRTDVPIQGALPAPVVQPAPQSAEAPQPVVQPALQTGAMQQNGASPQPAGRGRGRRRAAETPAALQAAPAQAPFMPSAALPPSPQPVPAQPAFVQTAASPVAPIQPPQPQFGMSPGVPPNPEMSAMLDNLFGPPQK